MVRARSSLLFFLPTVANGVISVAAIPILIASIGQGAWTEIALGQSVGGVGMTLISWGWSIGGPAAIGMIAAARRAEYYAVSVIAKLLIAIPTVILSVIVITALLGDAHPTAILSTVGTALLGLSASWFFVGTYRPVALLAFDTAPKLGFMIVGLVWAGVTGSAVAFPLSQIIGVFVSLLATWFVISGRKISVLRQAIRPSAIGRSLKQQSGGVVATLIFSGFAYAPLPLVSAFAPQILAPFAVIDKVQKLLLTAVSPLGQLLAARMAHGLREGTVNARTVVRSSMRETWLLSLGAAIPSAVAAYILLHIVSVGTVDPTVWILLLLAACVGFGFPATTMPVVVLAPIGRVGAAAISNFIGLIVLVTGILLFTLTPDPLLGVLGAVAIASLAIVSIEMLVASRELRRHSLVVPPTPESGTPVKPKIVVFSPLLPNPDALSAGSEYVTRHVGSLLENFDVTVVAPDLPDNVRAAALNQPDGLNWYLIPAAAARKNRIANVARKIVEALKGLSFGRDIENKVLNNPQIVADIAAAEIIEFQWTHSLSILFRSPELFEHKKTVLVVHDVYDQLWARNIEKAENPVRRAYARFRKANSRRFEARAFARVDMVMALSDKDSELIREIAPTANVTVLNPPLANDLTGMKSISLSSGNEKVVLYTGDLRQPRNEEAVRWFIDNVWDDVLAAEPNTILVIGGAGPSDELLATVELDSRIQVTGYVEQLEPYYAAADVFIAPMQRGSGVKFKVIASMLQGLPVVASTIGAEGIGQPDQYVAITDHPAEFGAAVISVLEDVDAAKAKAVAVQQWAEQSYGREGFSRTLHTAYATFGGESVSHLAVPTS